MFDNYETRVFYVDEGAVYLVWKVGGIMYVKGTRSAVTYRSEDTQVKLTGKLRRQTACAQSPWGDQRVLGRRGVLTLDTGEGLDDLHGVIV